MRSDEEVWGTDPILIPKLFSEVEVRILCRSLSYIYTPALATHAFMDLVFCTNGLLQYAGTSLGSFVPVQGH